MPSTLLMLTSRHPVVEELLHLLLVSVWAVAPQNIPEAPLWEGVSTGISSNKLLPKSLVPVLLHTESGRWLSEHWGEAGYRLLSQLSTQNCPSVSSDRFKLVPVLSGSDWSQDNSWFQRSKTKGKKGHKAAKEAKRILVFKNALSGLLFL